MTEIPLPKIPRLSSRFTRLLVLILLTLLMFIPLLLVSFVIADRASYQSQANFEISQSWGGQVLVSGPVMIVPVQETWFTEVRDKAGNLIKTPHTAMRNPLILLPESLVANADLASQMRSRGIFEVPVFDAALGIDLKFDFSTSQSQLAERETALWQQATLAIFLPQTRSFKGVATLRAGNTSFNLEPGTPLSAWPGIQAALGDPRNLGYMRLDLTMGGAQQFRFAPAARQTQVSMTSNWPDPSFAGSFLPIDRTIADTGFKATWDIPHLSRDVPQAMRDVERLTRLQQASFGVDLFDPVNLYTMASRAAKHGILFISLTFLTVFLMEGAAKKPAHPAQFLLIGLAQIVFFLLLLSFAEQFGFARAYAGATTATIALLSYYGFASLQLGRRAWVLTATLIVLYGTLYMILQSSDHALLAGSILAFLAVALTMVMTRNESWGRQASE